MQGHLSCLEASHHKSLLLLPLQAVYTVLREAEYRSTYPLPYWNVPLLRWAVPRQRRCTAALATVNSTLDSLISKCKQLVAEEDQEFGEEFVGKQVRLNFRPQSGHPAKVLCPI